MIEAVAKVSKEIVSKGIETLEKASKEIKQKVAELDKPLKDTDAFKKQNKTEKSIKETDKIPKIERMEPQIVIKFRCPEGMDRTEFTRQIKAQERGINSQSVAENMKNRNAYEQNGRDLSEGKKAQEIRREKAMQSRIESNQKKGMSYSEAKAEASEWMKTQAALHNPDQIAGGDPSKVSRMGDANVNSSIGAQWRTRVETLKNAVRDYAKGKTPEELANTKMNVKLVVV